MTSSTDEPPAEADRPDTVADTVFHLTADDPNLSERQKSLVLAAMESDEALAVELGGNAPSAPSGRPPAAADAEVEPAGAYLRSITVAGFRGIGAEARLDLHPAPGLTVIAGRNGSGKSSFAEALELALTGDSYRWSGKKATFWASSWRNLHQADPSSIRIELAEEGAGRTEIGVGWAAGAVLADRKIWTQRAGARRTAGVDALGWRRALELYRPILSYDELGQRLEATPTDLYRALASILGLEQITDAVTRLAAELKRLKLPVDQAQDAKKSVRARLASVDDERARQALAELRRHRPDLEALSKLATGVAAPDQLGTQLRALTQLTAPDPAEVESAARNLLAAVEGLAELGAGAPTLAQARTDLLERALALHTEHGEMPCPVCRSGVLDDPWRERVAAQLAAERAELATHRAAVRQLTECRQVALDLLEMPDVPGLSGQVSLLGARPAQDALTAWRDAPTSDVELARHLAARLPALRASFDRLRAEAGSALGQRDDNWREAAEQIAGWLEMERKADRFGSELQDVETATAWMKTNAETLRNQRLEPLAAQARAIWAKLRQNSSIDLDAITLSGQPTRGRVHLKASVDGVETEALPVMSQGELNAVALALLLPRATMAASPLRFVVLDDPVQAMDPEKVDGLTEVLVEQAKERQVVVFTHDDRLTESVRRTAPGARIVNVERGIGSTVEVRECQSPSLRYLDDAHTLLDDDQVPDEVLGRAIPGYARLAVEAAAHESYFRRRLTAGDPRRDVEAAWTRARKTTQRIALAVSADGRQDHSTWSRSRRYREQTVALCGHEVHRGMRRTARDALLDARKTVRDLLDGTS